MDSLLEYCLSKEDKGIRRFIWILQMKKGCHKESRTRRWLDIKRDKQIIILENAGCNHKILCDKAETYKCIWEMLN